MNKVRFAIEFTEKEPEMCIRDSLDTAAILRETEGAETVLILEDCFENGSVGQQLAAAMEEAGQSCSHTILQNLKDHFAPEGTVDQLRHRFGLDADGVVKTVKEAMSLSLIHI